MTPDVKYYLDTNVCSLIHLFSDCCKGDGLTLGYWDTSVVESARVMIPSHLLGAAVVLAGLRRASSPEHSCRRRADSSQLIVSKEMGAIIVSTGLNLEANIFEITNKSISKSKRIVTKVLEDERLVVVDGQRCYMVEASRCECGYPVYRARPCPHLILVHHTFLAALVHPRWLVAHSDEPFP
jgi:hypothetical protein